LRDNWGDSQAIAWLSPLFMKKDHTRLDGDHDEK